MEPDNLKNCLKQILTFSYDNNVKIDMSFEDGSITFYMSKKAIDGQIYKVSTQLAAAYLMAPDGPIGFYDIFGGMLQRLLRNIDQAVYGPVIDDGYLGKVGGAND